MDNLTSEQHNFIGVTSSGTGIIEIFQYSSANLIYLISIIFTIIYNYEPEELVGKTLIAITNLPPRAMMGIDSCGMLLSAIHEEEGEEKLHLLMVDDHIPAGAKLY